MKNKGLRCLTLLLCLLLLLPSCDTTTPQESGSDSAAITTEKVTEKETKKQTERQTEKETEEETEPEWAQMEYWDVGDQDPDLESVDYSKLMFFTDIITYSSDLQQEIGPFEDGKTARSYERKLKELVEAYKGSWKQVQSFEKGLELLKWIIDSSKNQEFALMVMLNYTGHSDSIYAVHTRFKEYVEYSTDDGNFHQILFYSKGWIEDGFTPSPEKLMEAFETYTRYSKVANVVISAVPIPAEAPNTDEEIEFEMGYPEIEDNDPDLESVDYSKLMFCTDIATYSNDFRLTTQRLSDVRIMKELIETQKSEWKQVASYDEGLELLKGIIADSKNTDCAIMLIIDYTTFPGIYAAPTYYKASYALEWNGGEKQCIWLYSKKWIEGGFTPSPEKLMEAFERYTRYSKVTSVVISAVPIPASK